MYLSDSDDSNTDSLEQNNALFGNLDDSLTIDLNAGTIQSDTDTVSNVSEQDDELLEEEEIEYVEDEECEDHEGDNQKNDWDNMEEVDDDLIKKRAKQNEKILRLRVLLQF